MDRKLRAALVAAAAFLMVHHDAAHWSQDPLPDRQAAVLVRAIQSGGEIAGVPDTIDSG